MITSTRDRRLSASLRSYPRSGRVAAAPTSSSSSREKLCIALDRIQRVTQIVPELGLEAR